MEIKKLSLSTLSEDSFRQVIEIERNCSPDPYTPEILLDCIRNLDTYACVEGGIIAGFITIHPRSRYLGGSCYIVNLNVAKPFRRQGIGESLILYSCSQYPESSVMTLDVCVTNAAALGLYRKMSFRKADIPSRNGSTDIVMYTNIQDILAAGNLLRIRRAEKASHIQVYSDHSLYQPGSWLSKPVKTVLEMCELLRGRSHLRALDLGCGVGRNAIPIAEILNASVDCVDILPLAIHKLQENAAKHGVADKINGIISGIDTLSVEENNYDLIIAVSALEHMDTEESFRAKLKEIRDGLRPGGIACLIINSSVTEKDKETGNILCPQFEINLPESMLLLILEKTFSGLEIRKRSVVSQEYDIPRENHISHLHSRVVTFAVRK